MKRKFPTLSQWTQIFKVLKKGEKKALLIFSGLAFVSLVFLLATLYIKSTETVPAFGGSFTEGIIGQPRFINPIYGETNDTDRTITSLVFSGLMTYNKDGKIINDLTEDYSVSSDGKTYSFKIKENVLWHDGKKLTADDVLFTIKTIQTPDYRSPLRANWIDVETEKTSDYSFVLRLKIPYNSFLENCTLKILPKHIWGNIPPENFALSSYNLNPIGSGPFFFEGLEQSESGFIKRLELKANRRHHNQAPFLSRMSFLFFEKKEDLIRAANQRKIDGFSLVSSNVNGKNLEKEIRHGLAGEDEFSFYSFSLPRYFAVFFNPIQNGQKSIVSSDKNIRKGLGYAIPKEELVKMINETTRGKISVVNSPILPDFFGYQEPTKGYGFDQEAAKELFDKAGFKDDGNGQRQKPNDKKPAFQFTAYLKLNSKGNSVTELQKCLAGLDPLFKELLQGETNGTYGKATEDAVVKFQEKYLPEEKTTGETGKKTRQKLNELCLKPKEQFQPLKFTLTTINQGQMVQVANFLKDYWQKVGVAVEVKAVDIQELKQIIKERNYEALLYGQALGSVADFYPFWHSSQKNDPGLNLSGYENKTVDNLLKEGRETLDESKKTTDYEKMQDIILEDAPALFLYNPDYLYWVSEEIKGINTAKIIDPAKRFSNISEWYIKTKRIFK